MNIPDAYFMNLVFHPYSLELFQNIVHLWCARLFVMYANVFLIRQNTFFDLRGHTEKHGFRITFNSEGKA